MLRPLELSDLDTTHKYASDHANTKYMVHLPNRDMQETASFLQRVVNEWQKETPQFYEFAIILDNRHIGAACVHLDESRQEGELGWIIHKNYRGKGYATEAAKAVLDFAKDNLKVKKIIAHCDYRNEASVKVMQKIGLSFESGDGVRRNKNSDEDVQDFMYSRRL